MKNIFIIVLAVIIIAGVGYAIKNKNLGGWSGKNIDDNSSNTNVVPGSVVSTSKVLDLSNKGLTKVPMSVFDQTGIEELNLADNSLEGSLQAEVRFLQNLKVLNLSNNRFSGLPAEVGQLKDLEILNLSNNLLTGLPNELGNLSKLKLLDLSGNNYSEADLAGIRKNLPSTTVIKTN